MAQLRADQIDFKPFGFFASQYFQSKSDVLIGFDETSRNGNGNGNGYGYVAPSDDFLFDDNDPLKSEVHRPDEPIFRVRKLEDSDVYEELYATSSKAYWSCNNTKFLQTFSADFRLIDVFWHSFNFTEFHTNGKEIKRRWDSVCLVGERNIDVHRISDGEQFPQALQFPVKRVFSTPYALLLERAPTKSELANDKNKSDQCFPVFFSLSHPLNEIVPIIYKPIDNTGKSVPRYVTSFNITIIHADNRYSLLLTYDRQKCTHSIWHIRQATSEDARAASDVLQDSYAGTPPSVAASLTPSLVRTSNSLFGLSQSPGQAGGSMSAAPTSSSQQRSYQQFTFGSTLYSGQSHSMASSMSCSTPQRNVGIPSSAGLPSVPRLTRAYQSPLSSTPRTGERSAGSTSMRSLPLSRLLRTNSPTVENFSPISLSLHRSLISAQENMNSPLLNASTVSIQQAEPFVPDLTLNYFWSESSLIKRPELPKSPEPASKAFVVEDFTKHVYFCYFVQTQNELRCLKILETENEDRELVAGKFTTISCHDVALALDSQFLIILDPRNCLCLYSGTTKIMNFYSDVISLLSPVIADSFCEATPSTSGRIAQSSELSAVGSTPIGRMTLPSESEDITPVHSDVSTSPTLQAPIGSSIAAVDVYCEKSPFFLLTLNSQRVCRCFIPQLINTPPVQLCLEALTMVLPNKSALEWHCQWFLQKQTYVESNRREFAHFMKFVMEQMGFLNIKCFAKVRLFAPTRDDREVRRFLLQNKLLKNYGLHNESLSEIPSKRTKCADDGTNEDYVTLLRDISSIMPSCFFSDDENSTTNPPINASEIRLNAPYFMHLPAVFYALHCCYEELKLDGLQKSVLDLFAECLHIVASSLSLTEYLDYYRRDLPSGVFDGLIVDVSENMKNELDFPRYWSDKCFSVNRYIYRSLKDNSSEDRFGIVCCCDRVWFTCLFFDVICKKIRSTADISKNFVQVGRNSQLQRTLLRTANEINWSGSIADILFDFLLCIQQDDKYGGIRTIPPGILLPWLLFLSPEQLQNLLYERMGSDSMDKDSGKPSQCSSKAVSMKNGDDDGMGDVSDSELLKMLFPNDVRVMDARRMLRSSRQARVSIQQRAGMTDSEFREEQERYLYSHCVRNMTLPIGRGMFTLRTHKPILTERVDIPRLCMTGRASSPQTLTIDLSHIDVPANMDTWARFHNGVAAGLRLEPYTNDSSERSMDSSWIVYNVPKPATTSASNNNGASTTPEYAGFFLGLGINGYLSNLSSFNLHEYLAKGEPMTSIALLLGAAAAKCGTGDIQMMRMLSTHLPFLLPPTLLELNIDPSVQTAAVLGVGLLNAESNSHRLAEALVREIGRPATALNDNFIDRESYALACGFSLGLVTLGSGDMVFADPDFTLADELCLLMNGGHKRPHHYAYDAPPSQMVKDNDFLNVHITSAPAIVALSLIYLKSNNTQVASWFDSPQTLAVFDTVRPDFLLLRIAGRSLIMWDSVVPKVAWIESHVPKVISKHVESEEEGDVLNWRRETVDLVAVAQAYCNIVAGGCMALGMKFAGSANAEAFKCLIHYYKMFDSSYQHTFSPAWKKTYNKAGQFTVETALNVIVMALGAIMAGTGNLDVMRIVRHLRQRVGPNTNNWLLHGGHLAAHMTLGMLFLGAGRYTLSTTNRSIAALFCALYPKFPIAPNDNRFHLQAFRHLYFLACERRKLIPMDHLSKEIAYCNVNVQYKACDSYDATKLALTGPCTLPELQILDMVEINDERYWPIRFSQANDWEQLRRVLENNGGIEIHRRSGYLTKKEDPMGYKSLSSLFRYGSIDDWTPATATSEDCSEIFLLLESLRLWCSKEERDTCYSILVDFVRLMNLSNLRSGNIWQLKLVQAFQNFMQRSPSSVKGLSGEFIVALESKLVDHLTEGVNANAIKSYIGKWEHSEPDMSRRTLMNEFLTFFDMPEPRQWAELKIRDYRNLRLFLEKVLALKISIPAAIALHRVLLRCT